MKPITSKVKKSTSPLKQTTDPEKKFTAQGAGDQGQLQNISVTGKPGSVVLKEFKPGSKDFDKAFGEARKSGKKTFQYKGKSYGTEMFKPEKTITPGSLNVEIEEPKTEAVEGTKSDVYRTFDQRKYGAGGRLEKIQLRQERKAGRQEEKMLKKAKKRGVEIADYDEQMKAAKEKRYGQGVVAKEARKQMQDPSQALIQREQITQKKTPRLSTYTNNYEVPTKASKGGGPVMAPAGTKSSAEVIEEGKKAVLGNDSGSVVSGTKKGLFNSMSFSESVMGDKKSPNEMKSSALKMTKGNSPFKMKGYGKKGC